MVEIKVANKAVNTDLLVQQIQVIVPEFRLSTGKDFIEVSLDGVVTDEQATAVRAAIEGHRAEDQSPEQVKREAERAERETFKSEVTEILTKVAAAIPDPDTVKDVKELAGMVKGMAETTLVLVKLMHQLIERAA